VSDIEPVVGHAYETHSRNLVVAACAGPTAFVGIREKFGHRSLFTEFSGDGPMSSVRSVLRDLGPVPEGILIQDHLPPYCEQCGRPTAFLSDGPGTITGYQVHADDGSRLENMAWAVLGVNQPLFDFLANMEKELGL